MLHTYLTDTLQLRYPILGAPMAGVGDGRLARAISHAGGLGIIGIGSEAQPGFIEEHARLAQGDDQTRFGLALMLWAVERRPELLDAVLAARPYLVSLSFGDIAPYVDRVHAAGSLVCTQVNSVTVAREAERAGVDFLVAQGTEAGGHTGHASTLPLLQAVLDTVQVPVVAAGGIASARGLAAVLAAGAAGAWIGTAFLACPECANSEEARRRVIAAQETQTVLTHVFDRVQELAWPLEFPGRALRNAFAQEWHHRADELAQHPSAREQYRAARASGDHDIAVIYAGQAVGMVTRERPAGEVVRDIGDGAEAMLRGCCAQVL